MFATFDSPGFIPVVCPVNTFILSLFTFVARLLFVSASKVFTLVVNVVTFVFVLLRLVFTLFKLVLTSLIDLLKLVFNVSDSAFTKS